VPNDDNDAWLKPAFAEMYRVLERTASAVSFYDGTRPTCHRRLRKAGFRMVPVISVFRKRTHHRFASYARARGCVSARQSERHAPGVPVPDVLDWSYTGNLCTHAKADLCPKPLIQAFLQSRGVVLDPSAAGSTLVAAQSRP